MCVCVSVCINAYIHTCIHTYIHTYIYIYDWGTFRTYVTQMGRRSNHDKTWWLEQRLPNLTQTMVWRRGHTTPYKNNGLAATGRLPRTPSPHQPQTSRPHPLAHPRTQPPAHRSRTPSHQHRTPSPPPPPAHTPPPYPPTLPPQFHFAVFTCLVIVRLLLLLPWLLLPLSYVSMRVFT